MQSKILGILLYSSKWNEIEVCFLIMDVGKNELNVFFGFLGMIFCFSGQPKLSIQMNE
ncbi:hypothetical protein LEP1GSC041_2746 [Leptospira noguchii str. 2006001870]|nr:hypothetical protein LEP1GSC041_2746 [Leptospira noguchii str. 2006001870]